jgi:glycerophosphoryl diester phosphodiesterase
MSVTWSKRKLAAVVAGVALLSAGVGTTAAYAVIEKARIVVTGDWNSAGANDPTMVRQVKVNGISCLQYVVRNYPGGNVTTGGNMVCTP